MVGRVGPVRNRRMLAETQPTALPSQVGGGRAIWLPWQGRCLEQTMFMRFGDTRVSHNRDNHTSSYYLYHEGLSAKGQFVGDQGI